MKAYLKLFSIAACRGLPVPSITAPIPQLAVLTSSVLRIILTTHLVALFKGKFELKVGVLIIDHSVPQHLGASSGESCIKIIRYPQLAIDVTS